MRNAIRISQKENEFLFTVETTGVLRPEEIVRMALAELKKKLGTVNKELEE